MPRVSIIDSLVFEEKTPLHSLLTQTIEMGRVHDAKAIVKELLTDVNDIQIVTEGDAPVVHLVFPRGSIPAAVAGDGIQMLLRLSLELACRGEGVVLLEEPEVHMHPGAVRQAARAILAAVRRGIQVILTTHSIELIDSLVGQGDESDLDSMSVFQLSLDQGELKHSRLNGRDARFARAQLEDDLR